MLLSIIVVNYKNRLHLSECLNSVFSAYLERISLEVIVVNNDAEDALEDVHKKFSEITIVHNGRNIGFGRAVNRGAATARGEVLLFLNPDTRIEAGALEKVLDEFHTGDRVGIIGSGLITEENKPQPWSAGEEFSLTSVIQNNLGIIKSKKIWEEREKRSVHWVSGAAMFVKRELFARLGGFDEQFFMYFEDIDLCRRARELNQKVIYFPGFEVRHVCGGSALEEKERKKIYYQSQDYYFQKHYGQNKAALLKFLRMIVK